jgi:biopolymer transport protein ExbD
VITKVIDQKAIKNALMQFQPVHGRKYDFTIGIKTKTTTKNKKFEKLLAALREEGINKFSLITTEKQNGH